MTARYATFLGQIDKPHKPYTTPKACPEMLAAGFEKIRWGSGYWAIINGKYFEVAFDDNGQAKITSGSLKYRTTFKRGADAAEIRRIMETLAAGRVPEVPL